MRIIPNALTILRLVLAILFPLMAGAPDRTRLAIILLAAASDLLDGLIARSLGITSWLGALLDGITDKLFTLSVLVTFSAQDQLTTWQLIVLLSRDIIVGVIAAYGASRRRWDVFKRAAARWPGKVTTLVVFALMVATVSAPDAAPLFLWLAMAASVAAALDYTGVFVRWLNNEARRAAA